MKENIIKPLEENLYDLRLGNIIFFNKGHKNAHVIKERLRSYQNLKLCPLKNTVTKMKR